MPQSQFVKFRNLVQIVEAFCGAHRPVRFRALDRDSEGFSGAVVLQVAVQSVSGASPVEYCLRGWPPDSLPRERLLGLHRLLQHVHQCGVTQVAVPLISRFDSTLYTEAGQFWQLEPWMPGRADFWSQPTDARLHNAMTVLARWHDAAARFEPRPSEARWFQSHNSATSPTVLDRLERIQRLRATDVETLRQRVAQTATESRDAGFAELRDLAFQILGHFDRSVARVSVELAAFRDTRFRLHPCLRDIWHDHVLFIGDEVTGVIDPSAAKSETPATDLARLLGSVLADDEERWDFAIAAYRAERPLSELEVQLVRVLDRSTSLLSGLTWLERLFAHRPASANSPRIIERLRQIVKRMKRLTAD